MSVGIALVVLAAAVAVGIACAWIAVRRRQDREAHRAARLREVVARIEAAVSSIGEVAISRPAAEERAAATAGGTPPEAGNGLPGRAALLGAVGAQVRVARSNGGRLSAAVVRSADAETAELAVETQAVADVDAYAVGSRAVALVLPGLGRADALGVLARIEARCPSSGKAVELEPGEDAVELVARLLSQGSGAGSGTTGA